jgi:hypothetical protein
MSSALDRPEIDLDDVDLPGSAPMSREELEAAGYVIGFGDPSADYFSDPCKHLSLNSSVAKVIARECPEDGWRMHPRGEAIRRPPTDAMDDGSLFDRLLTGGIDYSATDNPAVWTHQSKSKKTPDAVGYSDWSKFRVIDADSFKSDVVKLCRDDARSKGLIPVLQEKLVDAAEQASQMRARLALAGIDLLEGRQQVPIYWVEFAFDGTPVQCRGLIDQLIERKPRYLIRDLKSCESLQRRKFARQAYELGYLCQAAAYTSGVENVTGEYGRVSFEWALVRKGAMPAAAHRAPTGELLEIGRAEWRYAINTWARCLKDGLWPGYEMAGLEYVHAEPWMMTQAEELGGVEDGE